MHDFRQDCSSLLFRKPSAPSRLCAVSADSRTRKFMHIPCYPAAMASTQFSKRALPYNQISGRGNVSKSNRSLKPCQLGTDGRSGLRTISTRIVQATPTCAGIPSGSGMYDKSEIPYEATGSTDAPNSAVQT